MANYLKNYSVEELEKELEARKAQKDIKKSIKPVAFDEKRHAKFVHFIEEMVENRIEGREDEDDPHYIYEEALKYVYGNDIFEALNKL